MLAVKPFSKRRAALRLTFGLFLAAIFLAGEFDASAQTKKKPKFNGIFASPKTARYRKAKAKNFKPVQTAKVGAKKTILIGSSTAKSYVKVDATAKPKVVGNKRQPAIVEPGWKTEPLFRQADDFVMKISRDGYRQTKDFIVQTVQDDRSWKIFQQLDQNKDYVLLALCDENCDFLSLRIYDKAGKSIVLNKTRQSRQAVYFSPRGTDIYQIKTTVTTCRREPCRATLTVFER